MTEQTEYAYDLFISYAGADRAWVEGYLLDALAQAGVRCHSEAAFALGVPRLLEFERAIRQSQRTLLILSPAYLAEGFGQFTDLLAQSYGLESATWPVIPLLLQSVELPPRLAMLTRLDGTDPAEWPAVVERLCAELQRAVPGPAPKPPCPYPGMVPFSEADSDRFFGRDEEVQELLERLRLHPFLTVIGPSGSGKSSLVFAGLVPALRQSRLFGPGGWLVRMLRPGEIPLAALTAALDGDPANPDQAVSELLRTVRSDDFGRPGPAATKVATTNNRLLLVVDQFEELFTLARADVEPFQQALLGLAETTNCYVALTVRADFYSDLMATLLWREIQAHRFEVLPLDEGGLRQAIVRPAEDVRVFVETALVERLVADAGREPGILPLVQETLVLLWERVERRFLPLRAYKALVLPRAAYGVPERTGLQVAMARRADATLAALAPEQQAIVRRVFLRLVQFGEGRADTRRQQPVAALRVTGEEPRLFDQTLYHLTDNRLLTLSGEEGGDGRRVDIAHESLISGWPTLQEWLAERRGAEQTRRRLEGKAAEWVRLGRSSGGLLDEVELLEAERWVESPDGADLGYGETLPTLVEASRAAIEEQQQEKEAARQRELAQAQDLAEEQRQRAEEQTRASKRLRVLAGVLAGVTALAVAVALFAWLQWAESERLRYVSIAQALAIHAAQQHEQAGQDELGALLARQAFVFHQRHQGEVLGQIDVGLRTVLGAPYFSYILEAEDTSEAVAFSRDGRTLLASGNRGGSILLWGLQQLGDAPIILDGHQVKVISLAFSLDGQMLASAGDDGTVITWDISADSPVDQPFKRSGVSVAFSPVSPTLALGGDDGIISLWDLRQLNTNSNPTIILHGHDRRVTSLAFSPDGRRLASASWDQQVLLWNLEQPDDAPIVLQGHRNQVRSVAFSPDGRMLASGSTDGNVILWNVSEDGALCRELDGHEGRVTSVAFSPDGRTLASGSTDQTIRLWHLYESAGEECGLGIDSTVLKGHFARVTSVAFDQDGRLASGSGDETVRVWEPIAAPTILLGHTDYVAEVAFSPMTRTLRLASGSNDCTVRLWDMEQPGTSIVLDNHEGPVTALAFSPDGQALVSGSRQDGAIIWWDVKGSQEPDPTPIARAPGVETLTFSPDSQRLALGGRDGWIMLLDYAQHQRRYLEGHRETVFSVAFSPDSQILASGSTDETIILWDLQTNISHTLPITHERRVASVAFSPVTRTLTLASGGFDGKVLLWDLDEPDADPIPLEHLSRVYSVALSPDGQTLASTSGDGTVWLWDLRQSELLPVILRGHKGQVMSVVFSPDGRMLASGGTDQTIRVWRIYDTETLANIVCENVWRNLTQDEWDQFIGPDIPYECTCPDLPPGEGAPPDAYRPP